MIDLYFFATANGQRAAVMLEEIGLAYTLHKVDLAKGEQRAPDFLKLNPLAQIPVMVDHDGPGNQPLTLSQSGAIVLYLAEKSGKLMPPDPARRAAALQWFMLAASDIAAAGGTIFQLEMRAPEKSAANVEFFQQRLLSFYAGCDLHLQGRDFFADELSVADIMLYPNFAARKALVDQAGGFADLQRWATAMAARPAVVRGMKPFG